MLYYSSEKIVDVEKKKNVTFDVILLQNWHHVMLICNLITFYVHVSVVDLTTTIDFVVAAAAVVVKFDFCSAADVEVVKFWHVYVEQWEVTDYYYSYPLLPAAAELLLMIGVVEEEGWE